MSEHPWPPVEFDPPEFPFAPDPGYGPARKRLVDRGCRSPAENDVIFGNFRMHDSPSAQDTLHKTTNGLHFRQFGHGVHFDVMTPAVFRRTMETELSLGPGGLSPPIAKGIRSAEPKASAILR